MSKTRCHSDGIMSFYCVDGILFERTGSTNRYGRALGPDNMAGLSARLYTLACLVETKAEASSLCCETNSHFKEDGGSAIESRDTVSRRGWDAMSKAAGASTTRTC